MRVVDKASVEGTVLKLQAEQLLASERYRWVVKACNELGCTKSVARAFSIE